MSATSATSRARGADIIDLDRYIRHSVRPSDPRHARERLVVDAGGAERVPAGGVGKRYWHDSGLSASSCAERRRRSRRRVGEGPGRAHVARPSELEFRTACERALRDQQLQIRRVAELCQMLVRPPGAGAAPPPRDCTYCVQNMYDITAPPRGGTVQEVQQRNFGQNVCARAPSSTSGTSSSSGDERRKDKHRTESCETYNIIINKLDELGRLLAARRVLAPVASVASVAAVPKRDQLVATEDAVDDTVQFSAQAKRLQALHVSARRRRARSPAPGKLGDSSTDKLDDRLSRPVCALCRGYWRALRRCATRLLGACS